MPKRNYHSNARQNPPSRQEQPQQNQGQQQQQYTQQNSRGNASQYYEGNYRDSDGSDDGVLDVPVWHDSSSFENNSYLEEGNNNPPYSNQRQQSGSQRSIRQQQHMSTQQHQSKVRESLKRLRDRDSMAGQTPVTADEAFRLIALAVTAESEERCDASIRFFIEGGEMLASVAQVEPDNHIKSLLNQKAHEVLNWADALYQFKMQGFCGEPPKRMGQTVCTQMAGRLAQCAGAISKTDAKELQYMYYTSCSSKIVSEFTIDGYRLQCIQNGRRPQLMVVITMYNEDQVELYSTMKKVANNIQYIKQQRLPGYEGDDAWKNILVCIVSDGRTKANKGTLEFLRQIGCFDEDAMNINMVGVDVSCHIFEFCVQLKKGESLKNLSSEVYPPTQTVFALKEHNSGKLNSHEWYFNAFAEQIGPEYTVLLDVGTMPTGTAFYRLLCAMELNPQIGGTCGEIAVDKPIPNLCNWVIAAQHFEYKISNIMDKALESVFGFISVLPGAFSAYRYRAIRGPPLEAYFKSLTTPMHKLGPFEGNMYLAEDRILCFELLARKGQCWTMHYVKDAIARTDVPTDLVSLIGQRRRWLNGSFFALVYTIINWGRVYTESSHSCTRKLFLCIQYSYMTFNVALSWVLPANFFLVTYFLVIVGFQYNRWGFVSTDFVPDDYKNTVIQTFSMFYGASFLIQLVAGLGNKPKHIVWVYRLTAIFYALVVALTSVIAIYAIAIPVVNKIRRGKIHSIQDFFPDGSFKIMDAVAAIATLGVFFLASAFHCELHHICMSFIQYMALLPTFVNVLNTYSFCNLHDLSWGTKGLESSEGHGPKAGGGKGNYKDAVEKQKVEEERKKKEAKIKDDMEGHFQYFRSKLLILWLVTNMAFGYFVIKFDGNGGSNAGVNYLKFLFYIVAAFNLFRLTGSLLFILYHYRQSLFIMCGIRGVMRRRLQKRQKAEERRNVQQNANYNRVV